MLVAPSSSSVSSSSMRSSANPQYGQSLGRGSDPFPNLITPPAVLAATASSAAAQQMQSGGRRRDKPHRAWFGMPRRAAGPWWYKERQFVCPLHLVRRGKNGGVEPHGSTSSRLQQGYSRLTTPAPPGGPWIRGSSPPAQRDLLPSRTQTASPACSIRCSCCRSSALATPPQFAGVVKGLLLLDPRREFVRGLTMPG